MANERKKGLIKKSRSKPALIREAKAMLCKAELTDAITGAMVKDRGELGYVLNVLKERPRTFNPYLLKGMTVYKDPKGCCPLVVVNNVLNMVYVH